MKKILVLVQSYPSKERIYNMSFVHSRNKEYLKLDIELDVLNFSTKSNYEYEGVSVYTEKSIKNLSQYDAVVSHAPNLKNHIRFLMSHFSDIKKIVFVFHGHEILYYNSYYPTEYQWEISKGNLRNIYDFIKIQTLKIFFNFKKVSSIYVSDWMKQEAYKCMKNNNSLSFKYEVINNSINTAFIQKKYNYIDHSDCGDFVTIRPLDHSKYAVDLVVNLANNNPQFTFDIYGKGRFFEYYDCPPNVRVFDKFIEQKNIPNLLNSYKAAIMPTRLDAQGVMMCEMASYGIPMIISDLPVCREMLSNFSNCLFVRNELFDETDIGNLDFIPLEDFRVAEKFSPIFLAEKELTFFFDN